MEGLKEEMVQIQKQFDLSANDIILIFQELYIKKFGINAKKEVVREVLIGMSIIGVSG